MAKKVYASSRWRSVERWKASAAALREGTLDLSQPEIHSRLQALHEDEHGNLRNLSEAQEDEFYFLMWARDAALGRA